MTTRKAAKRGRRVRPVMAWGVVNNKNAEWGSDGEWGIAWYRMGYAIAAAKRGISTTGKPFKVIRVRITPAPGRRGRK